MNSIASGEGKSGQIVPVCWICGIRSATTATAPMFEKSVCAHCNDVETRSYDEAWRALFRYLQAHWREVVGRGSFDLSKVFTGDAFGHALRVHLYFVKMLGCKLKDNDINVDLSSFSAAILGCTPHAEVTLLVTDSVARSNQLISHGSDVSVLREREEVCSAVWMCLAYPIGIKVCYIKNGAPVRAPVGFPWHPTRQRRIVKISPYKGDAEPLVARRDLRI